MDEKVTDSNSMLSITNSPAIENAKEEHATLNNDKRLRLYIKKGTIAVLAFSVGIGCNIVRTKYMDVTSGFSATLVSFIEYFAYFTGLFTLVSTLLLFSEKLLSSMNVEASFIYGIFSKYSDLIALTAVGFAISTYLGMTVAPSPTPAEAAAIDDSTTAKTELMKYLSWKVLFTNIGGFYMSISLCAGVFLIKAILIYALSYNVHFAYYSERIRKNSEMISLLKSLSNTVNAGYSEDINIVCTQLVDVISNGRGIVGFDDIRSALSLKDATLLYEFLERNPANDFLEAQDFIMVYENTLTEQAQLAHALTNQNTSVQNLNFVANFICLALCVSIVYSQLVNSDKNGNRVAIIMTGLVSGGYIFSDIIKNVLGSLVFVFFVRPFEINDYVIIKGDLSKVTSINMLTSTVSVDKLTVIHPNNQLLGTSITNLRLSKTYEQPFTYPFNLKEFKEKRNELLRAIRRHVQANPKIFKRHVFLKDTKQISATNISTSIVVCFSIENVPIPLLRENIQHFVFDLNDICESVGLLPYE